MYSRALLRISRALLRISRALLRTCCGHVLTSAIQPDTVQMAARRAPIVCMKRQGPFHSCLGFFGGYLELFCGYLGLFCGHVLTSAIQPDTVHMAARRAPIVSIKRQGPEGRPIIVNTSHSGNIKAAIATTNSNVICVCVCVCVCAFVCVCV